MKYFLVLILSISFLALTQLVLSVPEPPGEYIGTLIQTQEFFHPVIQLASTASNTYYLITTIQLYYSTNGKTWEIKNNNLPITPKELAVDSSGNIYISSTDVYKSADGGATWNIMGQAGELGSTNSLKVKILKGTPYAWHPDQGLYYWYPSQGKWYMSISPTQYKVYDFMDVGENVYYVGVQNGEVKLFHGLSPKGTISNTEVAGWFSRILTYYDGAFYVILSKAGGGGSIYKSPDLGQTWEKAYDTPDIPKSISSSIVNGIQVATSGKIYRSWSGSVWKEVNPSIVGQDIISTNLDRQTIIASGTGIIYAYDRNAFPILNLTGNYNVQKNQDLQLSLTAQDLDGDTLTYKWEKVGGPSTYTLTGETTQTATFKATQDGTYNINASATDSSGGKSTKTVTITAGSGLSPPIAKVGEPLPCHTGIECYLTGWHTGTGTNVTYQWTQNSGPQLTWITNSSTTGTGLFIPSGLGTYNFTLTVKSVEGESTADLTIPVTNNAPVINLATTKTCIVQSPCKINATVTDPDFDSLTFLWYTQPINFDPKDSASNIEFVSGENTKEVTISVKSKGSYSLYFRVSDGKTFNIKKADIQSITQTEYSKLQANNTAPVANAGEDQVVRINQVATLDGNKSSDPENYPLSFLWEKVSGSDLIINNETSPNSIFIPPQTGIYEIRLTVTDVLGLKGNDTVKVTVVGEGDPIPSQTPSGNITPQQTTEPAGQATRDKEAPVIEIKRNNITAVVGEVLSLEAIGTDPQNKTLTYSWRQLSGKPVELKGTDLRNPTFVAKEPGVYVFEVVATNSDGKTSEPKTVTVTLAATGAIEQQGNTMMFILAGIIVLILVLAVWKFALKRRHGQ